MAQRRTRFGPTVAHPEASYHPWGNMTGVTVTDGQAYVTFANRTPVPITERTIQSNEAMVIAAFIGLGGPIRRADHKQYELARMIVARDGGTPPPPPPTPPTPPPTPTSDPVPVTTDGDATIMVPVTTDGTPGYMTPAEIVAAGGGGNSEPGFTRVEVTYPDRDATILPDLHHPLLPDIIRVIAGAKTAPHVRNLWLAGPAGTGKSTIPMQAAEALGMDCRSISCGPDDSTAKWFGFVDANGTYHGTAFRQAFENGGVFIIDEIDAADPGILTSINQALANAWYEFPDGKVAKHDGFVVVATANTWGNGATREYVGRQEIDAATLDRFGTCWEVPYDAALDRGSVMQYATTDALRATLERWLTYCLAIRDRAQANRIKCIVSPRRMGAGASLIAMGFTPADALSKTFFHAGFSPDTIATLTPEGLTL